MNRYILTWIFAVLIWIIIGIYSFQYFHVKGFIMILGWIMAWNIIYVLLVIIAIILGILWNSIFDRNPPE